METFDWAQVMAWRARRHQLDERAPAEAMLEVTARIAGLHAQVMSSAELTLWARLDGLEPDAARRRGRGRAAGGLERHPARARLGRGAVATAGRRGRTAAAAPTA